MLENVWQIKQVVNKLTHLLTIKLERVYLHVQIHKTLIMSQVKTPNTE